MILNGFENVSFLFTLIQIAVWCLGLITKLIRFVSLGEFMKKFLIGLLALSSLSAFAGTCSMIVAAMGGDGSGKMNFYDNDNEISIEVDSADLCVSEATSKLGEVKTFTATFMGFVTRQEEREISFVQYKYLGEEMKSQGNVMLPFVSFR